MEWSAEFQAASEKHKGAQNRLPYRPWKICLRHEKFDTFGTKVTKVEYEAYKPLW